MNEIVYLIHFIFKSSVPIKLTSEGTNFTLCTIVYICICALCSYYYP